MRRLVSLVCLLGLALPAAAQDRTIVPSPVPTLTVGGQAEVSARPDRAVVTLGAAAQAEQASAAQEQVSQIVARALDALREAGVAEEHIQTSGLSLYPVYSDAGGRPMPAGQEPEPRIVGYRAGNTLRIILDDISAVGRVIDAGISAGANQVEGVSFELKDDTATRAEALKRAAANARQKASALASATGVKLDSLHEIIEGGVNIIPPQPLYGRARAVAMEAATPVQPGQVQVQASVSLTYRISRTEVGADQ